GTTSRRYYTLRIRPVHPHARGDNRMRLRLVFPIVGSPPRAWGQLERDGALGAQARFTPTRVGTTLKFPLIFLDANQQQPLEVSDLARGLAPVPHSESLFRVAAVDEDGAPA